MGEELGGSFISAAAAARGSGLDTEQQPTITLRPAMQLSDQSTLPSSQTRPVSSFLRTTSHSFDARIS